MTRRRKKFAVVQRATSTIAAFALVACWGPPRPSIVLITLDTTRADHLGIYGYGPASTPHFDHFARGSVLYEVAYSTSSWTLPSHASLFTGLLPMEHGAQAASDGESRDLGYSVRPLGDRFKTLAEHLAEAGYRTAGVIAGPALRRELGVSQGFERYEDDLPNPGAIYNGTRAEVVADRAIALVEEFGEQPFFLFVNFFDPHAPYLPPAPHQDGLSPIDEAPLVDGLAARLESRKTTGSADELKSSERRTLEAMIAGYDAEIAYLDLHLGRLLAALEPVDRRSPLLIAITSDHGESFGEHDYVSHGAHLYEDGVRVPLVVRYPDGRGAGTQVSTPRQNHRLFATILQAAGLAIPEEIDANPLDGVDTFIVTEVQRSDANVKRFGDILDRDLRAIYSHPFKLIQSSTGAVEFYELAADAGETRDRTQDAPKALSRLLRILSQFSLAHPPRFDRAQRTNFWPATEAALEAIGYVD